MWLKRGHLTYSAEVEGYHWWNALRLLKWHRSKQDLIQTFALMDMGPRCVNMILFFVFDFLSLVLFYCCDFMVFNLDWKYFNFSSKLSSVLSVASDCSRLLQDDLVASHTHPLPDLEKTGAIIGLHFQSPLSQNSTITHLPGLLSIKSYSIY